MPQTTTINYLNRTYPQIRQELIDFLQKNYPEIKDYNDSSVGMALLELNAAVGDILSYHTDRMFNETQLDYIQERKNLLALARTYGLKVGGKKPSVCLLNLEVTVPAGAQTQNVNCQQQGQYFACEYAPIIKAGASFIGGGQTFEILDDVNFQSYTNSANLPDRTITAINAPSGPPQAYKLTKTVFVANGQTRYYSKYIRSVDVKPFVEIILPETNVISVEQIIAVPGNVTTIPNIDDFLDENKRWWEVHYLAQGELFVDGSPQLVQVAGSSGGTYSTVIPGTWKKVTKKFITEYTDNGYLKIIFGSGKSSKTYDDPTNTFPELLEVYNKMINNNALGETLSPNTTIFVRYRVGGGSGTNLGVNVITEVDTVDWEFVGNDVTEKQRVQNSLNVTNSVPAMGGADEPTIDEIRRTISYNFGAQERGVQLKDYMALINEMPTRYGKPYRFNAIQERDAISIYTLTLTPEGKLDFDGTNQLILSNLAAYLSNYRMMNDYVKVKWGRVFNIQAEIDVLVSKSVNKSDVASRIGQVVKEYFEIANHQMGDNYYTGKIYQKVVEEMGNSILTITDIRFYNRIGMNQYSNSGFDTAELSDPDPNVRQIDLDITNGILYGIADVMYEVRYPTDIKIKVFTLNFDF